VDILWLVDTSLIALEKAGKKFATIDKKSLKLFEGYNGPETFVSYKT